jgi:hypothetical protein
VPDVLDLVVSASRQLRGDRGPPVAKKKENSSELQLLKKDLHPARKVQILQIFDSQRTGHHR